MTAITFPRPVPDELTLIGLNFMPQPQVEVTPLRGGQSISADLGPTLWKASYDSGWLDNEDLGKVQAWYDTLLSLEQFLGYDKRREYPIAYPNGWGDLEVAAAPFDGTCEIDTVATGNVLLGLKGLPDAGFVLSPGDYLAFDYGSSGARALHRVAAGGSTIGGNVTVEVRPFIRTGWATNAVVSLYRAACHMLIMPDSYGEKDDPPLTSVSFQAIQAL